MREEIARRGQELCLLIEDLVLLHGIDRQLAQALTIPASAPLCRLRAAIAVTSGYLSNPSFATFTDRGLRFTLDMDLDAIGQAGLRDFVGRYLNAGRLSERGAWPPRAPTPRMPASRALTSNDATTRSAYPAIITDCIRSTRPPWTD